MLLRLIGDGVAAGAIDVGRSTTHPAGSAGRSRRAPPRGGPGRARGRLARGLLVWTQLFGAISFELFGHLHNVIHDYDAFFAHQVGRAGAFLVGGGADR